MLHKVEVVRAVGRPSVAKSLMRSLLASSAIMGLVAISAASAQTAPNTPARETVDANGVDLFLGTLNLQGAELSAGQSGPQGLTFRKLRPGNTAWADNLMASLGVSGGTVYVLYQGKTDRFTVSGTTFIPTEGRGSSLSLSGNVYTYTMADGTVAHFDKNYVGAYPYGSDTGIVTDITHPNGEVVTYTYYGSQYCAANKPGGGGYICTQRRTAYRIGAITNNSKYRLGYAYADWYGWEDSNNVPDNAAWQRWSRVTSVSMTNTAIAGASARTQSYGEVGADYYITDSLGQTTLYRSGAGGVVGIRRPGSTADDVTIAHNGGRVTAVTTAAGTTAYSAYDASGVRYVTVSPPNAGATNYTFDIASQRLTSMRDPLNRTTSWQYDGSGRVTRTTYPEGNYTQLTYDSRGNVTERRDVAKPGSGLADIVTSADFDASCSYSAKCNQPNWTRDAKGNQTDYAYNTATGNVITTTSPAAASGGVRPTTTYSYTTVNGVQQVSGISTCQTTASCVGTADEVKVSLAYDVNGLPTTISKGAGNGALTATTTIAYDDAGNAITVDGPLAGTADTTRYRYDAARRVVGVVGPDPDGGGVLKHQAQRTSYDAKGRVTLAEVGAVNSQSDGDWAGFVSLQQMATDYDGVDRKVKEAASAGGTTYSVTQYGYDPAGAYDCTAVRMNSATWASLPDACTVASTGAAGPDRITRNVYDNARQLTLVQSAYGTADQADEATGTYTANGKLASVTDGEGNRTSYEYDGFDRLSKTYYPVTTVGAGTSSGGDYEQFGYDAAGNVTSLRLRDGQTITYGYDNLDRMTSMVTPGAAPNWDVAYGYDLLGRVTSATGDGWAVNGYGYDALGRLVTEQTYNATTYHVYDLAGRQTRLTWSDGFYVDYDYNVTGAVTAIRENGAGVLASYGYDDLGRRTSIVRGNGTTTSYGYDGMSRLTSLSQDLGGSGYDFTHGFSYNPAGQIASLTRSNDAYAWGGHYNVDRPYTINGLNQATAAGATGIGYDGRGNLTSSGGSSYGYSVENQLTAGPGIAMLYEPGGGQLLQSYNTGTGVDTRFAWSGGQMIAEINAAGGAITKRYVPGPGTDEPVVWYEGAGTGDRRWLHADERGSVVAVSDGAGNVIGVNSYDEYGIPGAGNIGRFQYTGQAWLPELGMYYYKARIYSPTLGRFMQTDPIGYGDGVNWYNYVGGDPVNHADPTGTKLATWMWSCYGSCGNGAGYWNDSSRGHWEPIPGAADAARDPGEITVVGQFKWVSTGVETALATGGRGNWTFASQDRSQSVNDGSALESRRGERGWAGSNKGTGNPDKHMKPVPGRPGFGQIKDPQTGKLSGPKPWPNDPRLGPQGSNFTPIGPQRPSYAPSKESWLGAIAAGAIVIIGGIVYTLATTF